MGANEINLSLVVRDAEEADEASRRLHRALFEPEERVVRVGIFGRGRLGSALAAAAKEDAEAALAWQVVGAANRRSKPVDVAIDASSAVAVDGHLRLVPRPGSRSGDRAPPAVDVCPTLGARRRPHRRRGGAQLLAHRGVLRPADADPGALRGDRTSARIRTSSSTTTRGKLDAPSGTARLWPSPASTAVRARPSWAMPRLGGARQPTPAQRQQRPRRPHRQLARRRRRRARRVARICTTARARLARTPRVPWWRRAGSVARRAWTSMNQVAADALDPPFRRRPAMTHDFTGLRVALATPFRGGRRAGPAGLPTPRAHVAPAASTSLVPLGSTGEAATLDERERDPLHRRLPRGGRRPAGGRGHRHQRHRAGAAPGTRRAQQLGAQGALVVTPYYNKPMPRRPGRALPRRRRRRRPGLPLVVYNVPGRTGINLTPDALAQLWAMPGGGGGQGVERQPRADRRDRAALPAGKRLLAGDDDLALAAIAVGASGLVSVVANVVPRRDARRWSTPRAPASWPRRGAAARGCCRSWTRCSSRATRSRSRPRWRCSGLCGRHAAPAALTRAAPATPEAARRRGVGRRPGGRRRTPRDRPARGLTWTSSRASTSGRSRRSSPTRPARRARGAARRPRGRARAGGRATRSTGLGRGAVGQARHPRSASAPRRSRPTVGRRARVRQDRLPAAALRAATTACASCRAAPPCAAARTSRPAWW